MTLYMRWWSKSSPRKRNAKGKMVVWGGLTNSWEKREANGKGGKEIYTHLNAEFQRIAGRDKKAFFSDQCKEIQEDNRMGKTRDLFKKIRDTKGRFHAKMGTIKDRNIMDLTEQKILRRGGKNTQKNYTKKIFMNQITTMVWSLIESLTSWNSKVKWTLRSITMNKASGGDGIPVELFQILKDDAVKVLHLVC